MSSDAPSPRLPLPAFREEAGTSGATGQTTRRAGRSIFVGPRSEGCAFSTRRGHSHRPQSEGAAFSTRCGSVVAAASIAAEALVGAALNAPSLSRADGLTPEFAGTRC